MGWDGLSGDEGTVNPFVLRIGTRGSRLARYQAEWARNRIRESAPEVTVEIIEIKTLGDRDRNSPLAQIGGAGVFTKEIQKALAAGDIDLAVHSLKDLPTEHAAGLVLAAVPEREDPFDALISRAGVGFDDLPQGAKIGTGSLRRQNQLLSLRPDLTVVAVRGNVETRLGLVETGGFDAVVLALAGLNRLALGDRVTERLEPPRFLPAVGQGALGLECREDDVATRSIVARLDHAPSHRAATAERSLLAEIAGGCMVPLAAWAREDAGELALDAVWFPEGPRSRRVASARGSLADPHALGAEVARLLKSEPA